MNFLFASSHSLAIPIAKSLLKVPGFSGFLTKPDALSGRDRSLRENSFSFGVIDLGRPIFKADSASEISKILIRNLESIKKIAEKEGVDLNKLVKHLKKGE